LQAAIAISLKFAHCNFALGFIFLICPNDCIYGHLPRGTFVAKKKMCMFDSMTKESTFNPAKRTKSIINRNIL
jgi:hypothetical protein